jgi:transposase InsO family protein
VARAVRVGLNTRAKRLALIARHRDPYERKPDPPPPARHINATEPGEKVQLDCFYVGRLSGTKGTVWQYTAIDVASAFTWAELHSSERNPRSRHTTQLLHRVAEELAQTGWKLREVTTDNGSEFRAKAFGAAVVARSLVPKMTVAVRASGADEGRAPALFEDGELNAFDPARRSPRTSTSTSSTTTTTAPTPGASPTDACPPTSSSAHARPAPDDEHLSPQLRIRTPPVASRRVFDRDLAVSAGTAGRRDR